MLFMKTLKQFLLGGTIARQSRYEMVVSSLGAVVGISLVVWLSQHFVGSAGLPYVVASMGAAAVLLYAAPHSPLTQPWSFVGGHLISAVVGVTCAQWVPDLFLASGLAVGVAIFAMHQLNCLHPPGGAAALVAVIGGEQIQALGYLYVLVPVGLNVLILGSAVWFTRALLSYREQEKPFIFYHDDHHESAVSSSSPFSMNDLNSALLEMHTYIDVSIEDLNEIYAHASLNAHKRQLGAMLCRDIMSARVIAVEFGDYLDVTWSLMQQHGLKGLPVTDRAQRIKGMITVTDFEKEAGKYPGENIEERLKALLERCGELTSSKPEVVGQLMTSSVISLSEDAMVSDAFTIFSEYSIGYIPVFDDERRLSGMLSRSDVLSTR